MPILLWLDSMENRRLCFYYFVYFGGIILLSGWFVLSAQNAGRSSELIDREKIAGWEIEGSPYAFSPPNLFEYINGAADFYIAYGFVSLEGVTYVFGSDADDSITVDIYDMGEKLNAFGVFQAKTDKDAPSLNIGAACFGSDGYLAFYKDRYFVEINSFIKTEKLKGQGQVIARKLAGKIHGNTSPPKALLYFPETGRIQGSERYIKGGILGHAFLDRGIVCDYKINGETVSAFLAFFASKSDAAASFEQHKAFLQDFSPCLVLEEFGGRGLSSQEPYHKDILLVQKGFFIVGVYDLPKAQKGTQLLRDIINRL